MIIQDFTIEKYGWSVRVYYELEDWTLPMLKEELYALGGYEDDLNEIMDTIAKRTKNTGYIFSNIYEKRSIIIIEKTTSSAEFQDTFDHEKGHLAMHICIAENIDPFSEEYQYLIGEIGHTMFKAAKRFLCDNCRRRDS